jgi:uncharacterized membrane protein (UPF0127 family)
MHSFLIMALAPPFFAMRTPPLLNNTRRWLLAALASALCTSSWADQRPQLELPRLTLSAGMHLIQAQVAATPEQRSTGLMFRTEMPANEGMLFVFEQASQQCFWMKNTLIPLTAAFVADDGTLVNLVDMKPQSLDSHCSTAPVRYVLEMNQGWFAKRGIKAGYKLKASVFR